MDIESGYAREPYDACRDWPHADDAGQYRWEPVERWSHSKIGELLGLSKSRVQQIESRAMEKLRIKCLSDPVIREAARELGLL